MESIIEKIDCFFEDKPVLIIITKDGRKYRCIEEEEIMGLRGYFFKDEISSVI